MIRKTEFNGADLAIHKKSLPEELYSLIIGTLVSSAPILWKSALRNTL
ncbi:MAG: hypothetical protein PHC49_00740 [Desulfuromonadaceae bacterium]|nr:hypothetical protein [Desulfuromonadaceae bacterium]